MAFDCYFLGGVQKFVMDSSIILSLDAAGAEIFSNSYQAMDVENENGFLFYPRARMKIPANSPILPSPPDSMEPPITWSSVMRKT